MLSQLRSGATGVKGAIPEAMYGPVIWGAGGRVGVPELGLQEFAAGIVEAASVLGGGVATTQWVIKAVV